MKKHITFLWRSLLCLMLLAGGASCTDYLDRDEEPINLDDAFRDFINFQGFVEEIYANIPNMLRSGAYNDSWNYGDDEIFNAEPKPEGNLVVMMDRGDFRSWQFITGGFGTYLNKGGDQPRPGLWSSAFYCIRKANQGLDNLDRMVGTQEERDLIAGQLYFFRAWWHFELMMFWGGLPYIDQTLDGAAQHTLPRLSYQECADKAGEDFRRAADLLPLHWDDTPTGQLTVNRNDLRVNKIMALGYLGKNYLWAASPLMENGAQLGAIASGMTYRYNEEYARKAAEAFGELLTLVESGATKYSLVPFDYSDVYSHTETRGVTSSYSDLCYTVNRGGALPGSTEAIFRGPPHTQDYWWNLGQTFHAKGPGQEYMGHDLIIHQPTANAVDMYGMANGMPLDDPESGFDPAHPFKDRDPRFYHDIIFDGEIYANTSTTSLKYSTLYTESINPTDPQPGYMRNEASGSRTGYLIQKIIPKSVNKFENLNTGLVCYISYMRLADVYLMYAEACAAMGGASAKASNFTKTGEEAFNVVRDRVGVGHVAAKFTADKNRFIDEIRRERAVELMFEGFRFNDLQRWLLLTEAPYNQKWAQDFTRVETLDWLNTAGNDPKDARVANWETGKRVILTRPLGLRHYWLPFPDDEVYLYPEFPQNPGW